MLSRVLSRQYPAWALPVLRISLFTVLIILSARISVEIAPNVPPITAQTFMIFLTGMTLGPVEGAISTALYVGTIAMGAPLDARGLGAAALFGPTAGYLVGFVPGAFIAGLAYKTKEPLRLWLNLLCGLLAAAVILLFGTLGVATFLRLSFGDALLTGFVRFATLEPAKVLLAAAVVNLGQQAWLRWGVPRLG